MSLSHTVFVTFFVSMVPVLELRGAIPMGVAGGLSPIVALAIAVVGNLLPVPFVILFIRGIFNWLKTKKKFRNFVERMENRAVKKGEMVQKYAGVGLWLLVAIPLPGTGAWTGALVAALMNLRMKRAMPAITLGVITAGLIMTILTYGATHLLG